MKLAAPVLQIYYKYEWHNNVNFCMQGFMKLKCSCTFMYRHKNRIFFLFCVVVEITQLFIP